MGKSYAELDVYKDAMSFYIEIHRFTLTLPKFELYELGSQLRRAADSQVSNIVEGFGRKRYKAEFIRFLTFSHASSREISCHLEKIAILYPDKQKQVSEFAVKNEIISRKLYRFIEYVETSWKV